MHTQYFLFCNSSEVIYDGIRGPTRFGLCIGLPVFYTAYTLMRKILLLCKRVQKWIQ